MIEPVEIDIKLQQNVTSEGDRVIRMIEEMSGASGELGSELSKSFAAQADYVKKLKSEVLSLEKELNNAMKQSGVRSSATAALKTQLKDLKLEVKQEEAALKQLKEAVDATERSHMRLSSRMTEVKREMQQLVATGRQNTQRYRELQAELGSLSEAYRKVLIEQKRLARGDSFGGMLTTLQGVAGGMSALAGAWGLMADESEEFAKAQTRLQSIIAIVVGLQQMQTALTDAGILSTKKATAATQLYGAATQGLTGKIIAATVASKALMATLTLGLSFVITGIMVALDGLIGKMREKEKQDAEISKRSAETVASQLALYEKLRQQYVALGNDAKKKKAFLEEHRNETKQLGEEVTSLARADEMFISRSDNFVAAMRKRATAMAIFEVVKERYKEAIEKELEANDRKENLTAWDKVRGFLYGGAKYWANKAGNSMMNEAAEMFKATEPLWERMFSEQSEADRLFRLRGEQRKASSTAELNARKKLASMSIDIERNLNAALLATITEGRERRIKEIENEYEARKAVIAKQLAEISEIEKKHGVDGSKQRAALKQLEKAYETEREDKIRVERAGSDSAMKEIGREITDRFASEEIRRFDEIEAKYEALRSKVKAEATNETQRKFLLQQLEVQKTKEHNLTLRELELEKLDFEAMIAEKRAEIAAEDMLFDSDKEETILNARLESARLRKQKLEEIKKGGGQADEAIKEATLRIDELTAALNRIPAKRVQELGRNVKSIFSSLAKAPGDLGRVFEGLSQSVDKVMSSFAKGTSNWDRAAAAISGIMDLWSMAEEQAKRNAQAEKEYAEVVLATQHRAAKMRLDALKHKGSNPWGVEDPYARAIAGAKRYREAMAELNKSVEQLSQGQVQVGLAAELSGENAAKGLVAGAGIGSAVGAGIGSVVPVVGTILGGVVGGLIGGIAGGIFGLTQKKMVPVFKSLTEQYGTILKQGTKTFELNPKILEDYDKLDAATKKLVDNWQSVRDEAIKAQEEMEANFKDLTGDLGSMLSRALADGFRNGDIYAAMDDFESELDKMIGRIVEQMVFAAYFQQVFDELRERMKKSFAEGGDGTIADDMIWFSKTYRKGLEGYKKAMEETKTELEKQGINAFTPERAAAARKGLAQASQDSIDALSGTITNISSRVEDLVSIAQVNRQADEARMVVFRQMALHVEIIAANSTFLHRLEDIASDLSTMNRDGINLKK